jgi:hypothetical protein
MTDWKGAFKQAVTPLYRPAFNLLRSKIMIDSSGDWRDTLFVSTGGRTGGTWVSQLINFDLAIDVRASDRDISWSRPNCCACCTIIFTTIRPSHRRLIRRAEGVISAAIAKV